MEELITAVGVFLILYVIGAALAGVFRGKDKDKTFLISSTLIITIVLIASTLIILLDGEILNICP